MVWDTPFDPSMLDENVIILCPREELATELMEILAAYGVKWDMRDRLVSKGQNYWDSNRNQTCYRICNKRMGYSGASYYEQEERFQSYIKCTFYGIDAPDFDVASDDELWALFGIGGR